MRRPGSKPKDKHLILFPGFMCDEELWSEVVPGLDPEWTLHHANLFEDPSIEEMAARVLLEAPQSFVMAGFSMGGFVAREIAHTAPERVEDMALIATSARGSTRKEIERSKQLQHATHYRGFHGLSLSTIQKSFHFSRQGDMKLTMRIKKMADRLGTAAFKNQIAATRQDGHGRLSELRCPTFVIAGDSDPLRPEAETSALADGIPFARYEIIDRCGHMIPLEQPEALSWKLNDWLRDL